MASIAGMRGTANLAAYVAGKAGVIGRRQLGESH